MSELLRLVWINLMENKFKMLLTSLGVIVGAATIVLVIAIGQGSQADVSEQFKNLNAGAIEVSVETRMPISFPMGGDMPFPSEPGTSQRGASAFGGASNGPPNASFGNAGGSAGARSGGGNMARAQMNSARMTLDDVSDIKTLISGLNDVTLLQSGETTILGGSLEEEKTVTVAGVWPDYQYVSNLSSLYGRFIDETDEDTYHAVIGFALAEELFTYAPYAYGDYLEIDGKTYEIIGVLESMGSVSSGISPDQAIYLPYAIAEKHIFGSTSMPQMAAVAEDINDVPQAMTDIETILTENHPNASFQITDAGSAKEVASSSANTLA
ncbi:MAG: ABC transporter permease, partial [Clostridiales bacterium]|nr:ABC transporter permease [Clostridiales bacterium]